ncbi:hypothetical protein OCU04_011407 [Sclerotinia nivalis]|uniref:Uncharacterized protein n=1 Tax=Sclerotinia nivalis TaxID=352851 RepID=A0A9X0ABF0_9HELO|nr:hypothetical protein OCU04_011407 [Sclerotinia nivalis]
MSKNGYDSSATAIYHGKPRNKEPNAIYSSSNSSTTRSRHRDAISADRKPSKSKSSRSPGDCGPGYGWRQAPLLVPRSGDIDTEPETSDTENEFVKSITGKNRSREYRSSPRRDRNRSRSSTNGNNTDSSSISRRAISLYSEGSDPGLHSDRKSRPSSKASASSGPRGAKLTRSVPEVPEYHSNNFDWNHVPPQSSKFTDAELTDYSPRGRPKKGSRSYQSDHSTKSHKSTSTKSVSSVEQTLKAVKVKLSRPAVDDIRTVPGKRDVVIDGARAHSTEQEVIYDAATDYEGLGTVTKERSSSQSNRNQGTSTAHTAEYSNSDSSRRKRVGGPSDPTFMPTRKPVAKPKDLPNPPSREPPRISHRSNVQPREPTRERAPSLPEWENPFDKYGQPAIPEKEKKNRLKNMKMPEKLGRVLRGFGRRPREEGVYA